jgi:hypothetical protein
MRSADRVEQCPSSEAKRKTSTRDGISDFDPFETLVVAEEQRMMLSASAAPVMFRAARMTVLP